MYNSSKQTCFNLTWSTYRCTV